MTAEQSDDTVLEATRQWLLRAVIGLNLCPFAKSVYIKEQIRYVVSHANTEDDLMTQLETELLYLFDADPSQVDTTLLIAPFALDDFLDYNDFLRRANHLLKRMRLKGELQIASFHPQYQFSDSEPGAIENYTNRAPYPTLHLLRETSITRAVESFPDPASIYERNQETLRQLGIEGWHAILHPPRQD
ncbi:DUF1415 domain-containing protein [Candidimonas sp. SYP-B2681]|uniref:DUF1415 domain-containing protein n=1 Tax=Candidimonas sp. SYP-B2681 TaxID=2497686 RepID=UPI000F8858AE|nr:DUF1415 domain-containing protein [Candidimonas sp. SYP-B2681]RTZ48153.1 DUF1415 domain-containing protein [Candidimonas sp. SYP-B2681]